MTTNAGYTPRRRSGAGHPVRENESTKKRRRNCYEAQCRFTTVVAGGGVSYAPATSTENYRFRFDNHQVEVAERVQGNFVPRSRDTAPRDCFCNSGFVLDTHRAPCFRGKGSILSIQPSIRIGDTKRFDLNSFHWTYGTLALQMA